MAIPSAKRKQNATNNHSGARPDASVDATPPGRFARFSKDGYGDGGYRRTARVLVLISDAQLLHQLASLRFLPDEFLLEFVEDTQKALNRANRGDIDVILVDVDFADIGGHLMCRLLRNKGIADPLIMLSAHESESDAVLGFESGADDFVAGPLNINTFVARLRARTRHAVTEESDSFEFGPYAFHFINDSLLDSRRDKKIHLTPKEASILHQLCRQRGKTVHREDLLRAVWNRDPTTGTHTLESHIYRLRKKLEPTPSQPIFIVSSSLGYRIASDR